MRRLLGAWVLLLVLCPIWAWATPEVKDLVDGAIKAVKTKSYEARLRFLSEFEHGAEQTVKIYHVAPELYRVEPLNNGVPGRYQYIENSMELVKLEEMVRVEQLPQRQYFSTDMLTVRFLRDLGTHPGTSVLDGQFNGIPVYYLRQDVTRDKPYLITVGLRRDNRFPEFLQVVDANGQVRVHYEFETLKFVDPVNLPDSLFVIPEPKDQRRTPASHLAPMLAPAIPPAANAGQAPGGGKTGKHSDKLAKSPKPSGPAPTQAAAAELPLFPKWLPENYQLEGISVLDYSRPGAAPSIVYHFEIYGPQLDDMISVFQMRCNDIGDCDLSKALAPQNGGYLLQKEGDWVVAVFGGLPRAQLQRVIDGLDSDHRQKVQQMLSQTQLRDQMMQQAIEAH